MFDIYTEYYIIGDNRVQKYVEILNCSMFLFHLVIPNSFLVVNRKGKKEYSLNNGSSCSKLSILPGSRVSKYVAWTGADLSSVSSVKEERLVTLL
jgi:hypothetical protein